jgi:hypothetical protein
MTPRSICDVQAIGAIHEKIFPALRTASLHAKGLAKLYSGAKQTTVALPADHE